jgi:hypothetical protein
MRETFWDKKMERLAKEMHKTNKKLWKLYQKQNITWDKIVKAEKEFEACRDAYYAYVRAKFGGENERNF